MNNAPTSETILETLADMTDPESGRLLSDLGQIGDVTTNENQIIVNVSLTTHSAILWNQTRGRVEERLRTAFPNVADIQISITSHKRSPAKIGQIGLQAKSVIAPCSIGPRQITASSEGTRNPIDMIGIVLTLNP